MIKTVSESKDDQTTLKLKIRIISVFPYSVTSSSVKSIFALLSFSSVFKMVFSFFSKNSLQILPLLKQTVF